MRRSSKDLRRVPHLQKWEKRDGAMTRRITAVDAQALADVVTRQLGLGYEACRSCKRWARDGEDLSRGCRIIVEGAYGGYAVHIVHANTSHSNLKAGYGPLREAYTFLEGMRAAMVEANDRANVIQTAKR